MNSEANAHRIKALQNEAFAESLDKKEPIQESWALVVVFYAALHYVEQFFAAQATPCRNHEERNRRFKQDIRIRAAYTSYQFLSSLGHAARYHREPLPAGKYAEAVPHLAAVKRQIDFALGKMAATAEPYA